MPPRHVYFANLLACPTGYKGSSIYSVSKNATHKEEPLLNGGALKIIF